MSDWEEELRIAVKETLSARLPVDEMIERITKDCEKILPKPHYEVEVTAVDASQGLFNLTFRAFGVPCDDCGEPIAPFLRLCEKCQKLEDKVLADRGEPHGQPG